jgi:peptidoglycan/LPS O-acetylase OafA/YrhL
LKIIKKESRILDLDSLRGIAAISVVLAHITLSIPVKENIFRFGVSGVDLFFLISGFVIFMTIEKTKTAYDFIIARVGRLYPAYWVGLLYTYLLYRLWCFFTGLTIRFSITDFFANLTMFQRYFQSPNIVAPSWTLLIEMQFYIVIIFIFLFNGLKIIISLIIFGLIIVLFYCFFIVQPYPILFKSIDLYFPLINHLPLFFSGILFFKLRDRKYIFFLISLIAICFVLQIFLFKYVGTNSEFMSVVEYVSLVLLYHILFALLILGKLNFINNVITQFLGRISYSMYLIHLYPSGLLIGFFTNSRHFHFNLWLVILLVVLPYIIITSYLLNKYIEVPGVLFFKKHFQNNSTSPRFDPK